jgi:hypothetical protein
MTVALNYDASFDQQFGFDGYNVMRRVAAHAENLYQVPILTALHNFCRNVFAPFFAFELI